MRIALSVLLFVVVGPCVSAEDPKEDENLRTYKYTAKIITSTIPGLKAPGKLSGQFTYDLNGEKKEKNRDFPPLEVTRLSKKNAVSFKIGDDEFVGEAKITAAIWVDPDYWARFTMRAVDIVPPKGWEIDNTNMHASSPPLLNYRVETA
jgi:hypothetical protein